MSTIVIAAAHQDLLITDHDNTFLTRPVLSLGSARIRFPAPLLIPSGPSSCNFTDGVFVANLEPVFQLSLQLVHYCYCIL
jgi:hypothetical protein